jgi:hypothetical protein
MNKLVLAAVFTLSLSPTWVHAGDPQGPESLDTGSLGQYYDPTTSDWLPSPPPLADIPAGDDYATVFADITDTNGTFGEEWLIPYDPNGSTTEFSMIDDTLDSFTISNAGFQLSPTLIPLDDLNYQTLPPDFAPLPSLNGDQLSNGQATGVVSLPEPGSFWLAGLAAAAFFFVRRTARRALG